MTDARSALLDHLNTLVSGAIERSAAAQNGVYAIALITCFPMEDPRRGCVEFYLNTEDHAQRSTPKASSEAEARWNIAFWPEVLETLGEEDDTTPLREAWIRSLALWWTDEDEQRDEDACYEKADELQSAWYSLLASVATRLHQEGVLTTHFGNDLPIIVGDVHLDDDSFEATESANPDGQASPFLEGW